jgi:hypothetical protein
MTPATRPGTTTRDVDRRRRFLVLAGSLDGSSRPHDHAMAAPPHVAPSPDDA